MYRYTGLILLTATVALPSPSRAEVALVEDLPVKDRPQALRMNLGLFSAVGELGFTYSYMPTNALEVEGGIGLGYSGMQFSLMPKLMLAGDNEHQLVVGLGPSMGIPSDGVSIQRMTRTVWLNAEVGYQRRWKSGRTFMVASGLSQGLSGCLDETCLSAKQKNADFIVFSGRARDYLLPTVRLAFGRWF